MTVAARQHGVADEHDTRLHVRTLRMQRHVAVAGTAIVACTVLLRIVHPLARLVILAAFLAIIIGSLVRAIDARLGYWWGWMYGEPKLATWADVLVDSILRRLVSVSMHDTSLRESALDPLNDQSMVRIVPADQEPR